VTTSLQQEAALQNHNVWKKELVSIIWEDAPNKTLEMSKKGQQMQQNISIPEHKVLSKCK